MPRKGKLSRAMLLWPGLPQLWKRGSWAGLVVAVGFTTLVNLLILSSVVYREWFTGGQQLGGLLAVFCLALWAWWQNHRDARREALAAAVAVPPAEDELPDPVIAQQLENREQWYSEAQQVYLQGDWVATEQLLLRLLKQDGYDGAARLMLATLWRKQGRTSEALRQLDKLARQESGESWQFEIAAERGQIVATQPEPTGEPETLTMTMTEGQSPEVGFSENTERDTANDPTEQRRAA